MNEEKGAWFENLALYVGHLSLKIQHKNDVKPVGFVSFNL